MTAITSVAAGACPACANAVSDAKPKRAPRRFWTAPEVKRLTALYPDTTSAALVKALGRDKGVICRKARQLGLQKSEAFASGLNSGRKLWMPEDTQTVIDLYPNYTAIVIGQLLGRKPGGVHQKAKQLGLSKSEAFLASDKAGRILRGQMNPRMTSTQWKTGQTPWNKGMNYVAGGRSAETRFRPGMQPHTTLPVGMYRLCDGQLQRKTSEAHGPNNKRWTPVTRLVWEAAHGPVPDKHIVVFKPGRASNMLERITLDALDCITRAENARRNHPNNKSPELGRLCQLKGAITRQVNRITKEAEEAKKATA